MILTAIVFLVILSVLVLIHELGHFLVAKKFNIKVEEFGYGLPPRIWGKKIGETLYSINWLPIGGFVKLYGEDEAGAGAVKLPKGKLPKKELDRAFFTRSVKQRAAVVIAGVVMNTLLAVIIFYAFMFLAGFKTEIPLIGEHTFFLTNQTVKSEVFINDVAKGTPAEKADIPTQVKVSQVNGQPVSSIEGFTQTVKSNSGKQLTLTLVNPQTNQTITKTVTPEFNEKENKSIIGVGLFAFDTAVLSYETPLQKVLSGFTHPANLLVYNFELIGRLIGISIQERTAAPLGEGVAGPVGIYSLVGTIVQIPDLKERVLQILNLAGILSISLAFFNVLPIPALDGGRLFFILIEGVLRRKINPQYEAIAHTVGMAILLFLILLITFKDVFQFLI